MKLKIRRLFFLSLVSFLVVGYAMAIEKGDASSEGKRINEFMDLLCHDQKNGLPAKYFPKEGIKLDQECTGARTVKTMEPDALSGSCEYFYNTDQMIGEPSWTAKKISEGVYSVTINGGNMVLKVDLKNKKLIEEVYEYAGADCE